MKKIAVITDAVSPAFFFPVWHRYYGGLFGAKNLHVVTYKDLKQAFAGIELGNLWEVNAAYDDTLRAGVIADLVAILLRTHDVVIRCDIDEFLHPDPRHFTDLAEFIERNELPYVTAQGIDAIELAEDAPLDLDKPIFGVQRRYGLRASALYKTCITTIPLRWGEGFHGATVPPRFAGLYNMHLKFADIKRRLAWDETILQGLVPGSQAHRYFSMGAAHLTGVQRAFAGKPKGGAETQAEFDARFLQTVRLAEASGMYNGEFFTQDFLIPLSGLGFTAPVFAPAELLRAYDGVTLRDTPADVLKTLEEPRVLPRQAPEIISAGEVNIGLAAELHVHGSYLLRRENMLLFGRDHLVSQTGAWSCGIRTGKHATLPKSPGAKPKLDGMVLDMAGLDDVALIEEPVFLATPPAPAGWVAAMAAKAARFRQYGAGRKFFCVMAEPWQRGFLQTLGVPEEAMLPHDPAKTYICRDVMTVEYSAADFCVSAAEREMFFELTIMHRGGGKQARKIFVSDTHSPALEPLGFVTVTPEKLNLAEQIAAFSAAEQLVLRHGAGIASAAFCAPDSSIITIETTERDAAAHADTLASLGLRHGIVFAPTELAGAVPAIEAFFNAA